LKGLSTGGNLDSSEYSSENNLNFVPSNVDVLKWDVQDGKMAVRVFNNGKINFVGLFQRLVC